MRHHYRQANASYGTGPVIFVILCLMAGMVAYLVAFGEIFRPSPSARVYLADMPELYIQPTGKQQLRSAQVSERIEQTRLAELR